MSSDVEVDSSQLTIEVGCKDERHMAHQKVANNGKVRLIGKFSETILQPIAETRYDAPRWAWKPKECSMGLRLNRRFSILNDLHLKYL